MYSEKEARELVIEAGHKLLEKKLVARTWGNISARISESEFIITPSGKGYDTLRPEDLVKVKIADCSWDGNIKPSSEKGVHADAYRLRPEADFVIHTHQFYASAVAAEEKDTDFAPCAAYGLPGTKKLRKNVSACISENPREKAFLLAKHGTLLIGNNADEAFSLAAELEENSRAAFLKRVPDSDREYAGYIDPDSVKPDEFAYAALQQDPYVSECCRTGLRQRPYVDDFAQMIGVSMNCCDRSARAIKIAAAGRNAVLVKGVGAICFGNTMEDALAAAMIVSKNCACACYVRNAKPLGIADSALQRYVYLNKYSKQKDE